MYTENQRTEEFSRVRINMVAKPRVSFAFASCYEYPHGASNCFALERGRFAVLVFPALVCRSLKSSGLLGTVKRMAVSSNKGNGRTYFFSLLSLETFT